METLARWVPGRPRIKSGVARDDNIYLAESNSFVMPLALAKSI
jgi:hypothetical protein